jgi:hypothetical protein
LYGNLVCPDTMKEKMPRNWTSAWTIKLEFHDSQEVLIIQDYHYLEWHLRYSISKFSNYPLIIIFPCNSALPLWHLDTSKLLLNSPYKYTLFNIDFSNTRTSKLLLNSPYKYTLFNIDFSTTRTSKH